METFSDDSFDLGFAFLALVAIFTIVFFYYPEIQKLFGFDVNNFSREAEDNSSQPLRQVFLGYNHPSVEIWCDWISNQEVTFKNEAFNRLTRYLHSQPDQIGVVINEVIKAIVSFRYPESFTSIVSLMENVRKSWGFYHLSEQFYGVAASGLVQLSHERSQTFLVPEYEIIKHKKGSEPHLKGIVEALKDVSDSTYLSNFWVSVLIDDESSLAVKEKVLDILIIKSDTLQVEILTKYLNYIASALNGKLSEAKLKLTEKIFNKFTRLLIHRRYPLWDTLIECAEEGKEDNILYKQIASLISDKSNDFTDEQLIQLFSYNGDVNMHLFNALSLRFTLNHHEMKITNRNFNIKESTEVSDFTRVTKFDFSLDVPELLAEHFDYLQKTLSLDKEFKNKNIPSLNILTGSAKADKKYLLSCLASKFDYKLVYINTEEFINSISESAKLKPYLSQTKPVMVYLEGLSDLLTRGSSDYEEANLEMLNNTIREFKTNIDVFFFAEINENLTQLEVSDNLTKRLKELLQIDYWFIRNLDNPDVITRQKIFNDFVKQILPERIKSSEGLDLIAKYTQDYSIIEFLRYLHYYFKHSLLVYGYLINPKEIKVPSLMLGIEEETETEQI